MLSASVIFSNKFASISTGSRIEAESSSSSGQLSSPREDAGCPELTARRSHAFPANSLSIAAGSAWCSPTGSTSSSSLAAMRAFCRACSSSVVPRPLESGLVNHHSSSCCAFRRNESEVHQLLLRIVMSLQSHFQPCLCKKLNERRC